MTLKVGFVGAGKRATSAHYPAVTRLSREGAVQVQALCDLNAERLHDASHSILPRATPPIVRRGCTGAVPPVSRSAAA